MHNYLEALLGGDGCPACGQPIVGDGVVPDGYDVPHCGRCAQGIALRTDWHDRRVRS